MQVWTDTDAENLTSDHFKTHSFVAHFCGEAQTVWCWIFYRVDDLWVYEMLHLYCVYLHTHTRTLAHALTAKLKLSLQTETWPDTWAELCCQQLCVVHRRQQLCQVKETSKTSTRYKHKPQIDCFQRSTQCFFTVTYEVLRLEFVGSVLTFLGWWQTMHPHNDDKNRGKFNWNKCLTRGQTQWG